MNAIDNFIENWKAKAKEHYLMLLSKYNSIIAARSDFYKNNKDTCYLPDSMQTAEYVKEKKELRENLNSFIKSQTGSTISILDKLLYAANPGSVETVEGEISKILDREGKKKKENLIARVEKKAGKIIDSSCLKIGVDGNLNGFIEGDLRTVEVSTIYAGGYNIQCLHYRVLVK